MPGIIFSGTAGADSVTGSDNSDALAGAAGNDTLIGGPGDDYLEGGAYQVADGGSDFIDGGTGRDEAGYRHETTGVSVDLRLQGVAQNTGGGGIDTLMSIEDLVGTSFADTLVGDDGDNKIDGIDGNDFIDGRGGDDDLFLYSFLNATSATLLGGDGNDIIRVFRVDNVTLNGGNGSDIIVAGDYDNATVDAGSGDDIVTLSSYLGNATITLGAGSDTIFLPPIGNYGVDTPGSRFVTDFTAGNGGDRVDLFSYVSDNNLSGYITVSTNPLYRNNPFSTGHFRLVESGGDTLLQIDADGPTALGGYYRDFVTLVTLRNVRTSDLTAFNLGGYVLPNMSTATGGSDDDTLTGSPAADQLNGASGNDTLIGGGGVDTMIGGVGNDTYSIDNRGDVVTEAVGGGDDSVTANVTWTLGPGQEVEQISAASGFVSFNLSGNEFSQRLNGNEGANLLVGLAGNDTLVGNGGSDTLDGGTGADSMIGGAGDDVFFLDSAADVAVEGANGGSDTIVAGYSLTLGENFEHLTLLEGSAALSGTGTAAPNLLVGNSQANNLSGEAGNDTLDGGAGNDTMAGGIGDDTYYVDSPSDQIMEVPGGGSDTVMISASYTLSANVENLIVISGLANLIASGNELDNRLTSDHSSTVLNGGDGNDTIEGGDGNDRLAGDAGNDLLKAIGGHDILLGGDGADTISGSIGNDHLYGQSASGGPDGGDILTGGAGADYMQGNAGNDILDGGAGSDRINGGADADTIRGEEGNDTVNGNLGADIIDGGFGNDSLRGGQGNDSIFGGGGNDVISGDLGVDTLIGGGGSDAFIFGGRASLFAGTSADVVTDFQIGTDTISVGYTVQTILTGAAQSSFSEAAIAAQQLFNSREGNGEVAAIPVGSDTYLFYSSNGGITADSAVQFLGVDSSTIMIANFT
ncbi:calcium-binding protein [Rhizorhabdus phycosphaerae]|uniref:calcium-binding protein n=1 Tax=Rhizorhabdus phycosphaerae TaxID=2711156 RepID=UPI0013E9E1A4|nr:calcium-binding protein [Rhizorhabdus phycosphaerae]